MISAIENIPKIVGWLLFWIALAIYGGTISSRGWREGPKRNATLKNTRLQPTSRSESLSSNHLSYPLDAR